jgi:3-oxoacyl-[acyl-carrier-protein] synthase-3
MPVLPRASQALDMAGVSAEQVDLILLCTSSPDDAFGGACLLQAALKASNAVAFDITAACSGFVVGLVSASHYVRCGTYKNVLVVGADALSRYVDWRDRGTCILFGDGAGAVLVQGVAGAPCSLLGFDMNSDGNGNKHLTACYRGPAGAKPTASGSAPSDVAQFANIAMSGQDVFKFAVRSVPSTLAASLSAAGLEASAVDWLVMHQANQRILDAVAQRMDLPAERVVSNIARFGNTSAASIPLALDGAVRSGKVRAGDVLATAGFGAGLSWASAIVKWG